MSITGEFLRQLEQNPQKTILFGDDPNGWTYHDLMVKAGAIAKQVNGSTSKRIGILTKQGRLFGATFFGVLFGGGVPVPLNYYFGADTLSYICEVAGIKTVFGDGAFPEKENEIYPEVRSIEQVIHVKSKQVSSSVSNEEIDINRSSSDEDLATILFTSGTTAKPKGVMLTQENLLSNIRGCQSAMNLTKDDHFLTSLPLFHSFGLTGGLLLPLLSGIPTAVQSQFSPKNVLKTLQEQRITVYLAVPSQYRALSRAAQQIGGVTPIHSRHDSIRFISGGEPLPEPVRDQIRSALGQPILEGYGLTVTSPVVSVNNLNQRKQGTAGKPLDNVQVRVADPDQPESSLPPGNRGEIQVKGASVMNRYLNRNQLSKDPFTDDEWFRTGDAGMIDDDGFIKITGRLKQLIVSAGENISPLRIEESLLEHDSVQNAAVVGVSSDRKGEVPVAFVTLRDGAEINTDELWNATEECLGKRYVPDKIHVQDEFPMGPSGKVLKRKLKEQAGYES